MPETNGNAACAKVPLSERTSNDSMYTNTRITRTAGTASGRAPAESGKVNPSRNTVKSTKNHPPGKKERKLPVRSKTKKPSGTHNPRCLPEAIRILEAEGYRVFRNHDPGFPFNLDAWNHQDSLLVRVVLPRDPVRNAANVAELYEQEIRQMESHWKSHTDNLQFWIFSREKGLLRYRVYDWGIGNVETMQKIMKTDAIPALVPRTVTPACPVQQSRSAPCPFSPPRPVPAPV